MRDGLSLTDQAIAYGAGQLSEDGVRNMLGSVDRGHALALVHALAQRDGALVLATVNGLRSLGLSASGTLEEMALLLQQMAIEQAVPGALDADDPDTDAARQAAPSLSPDETQLLYSMVLHGREELSLMGDEYGALTMVLLRFMAFPPRETAVEPAREVRAAPLRAPAPPAIKVAPLPKAVAAPVVAPPTPPAVVPAPAPVAAATVPTTPVSAAPSSVLGDRWYALVKPLCDQGTLTALARELAMQGGLRAIDDSVTPPRWHVTVEREALRSAALRDKLAAALAVPLGHAIELTLEANVPEDSPARRDTAERARLQAQAEDTMHNDPVVKELLAQFKTARIVPGSIKPL
jgi:DNA polymerase III subunit gamma/tau